jgi:hypothetical protein
VSLIPATATTPTDEDPISFVPVGHLFPTVHDPEASEVAALVAQGWDQWEASRVVFSEPAWDAHPVVWSTWVRRTVVEAFAPLRRAVGLR